MQTACIEGEFNRTAVVLGALLAFVRPLRIGCANERANVGSVA